MAEGYVQVATLRRRWAAKPKRYLHRMRGALHDAQVPHPASTDRIFTTHRIINTTTVPGPSTPPTIPTTRHSPGAMFQLDATVSPVT